MSTKPLNGIRVLELGQLIAGPFAAKMLGEFGAEIIKIEPPGKGDPLRNWRLIHDGTSVWWQVQSRNKKSVSLDLRQPEAQELIRKLAAEVDVVIENFKPGTMEGWGLGWEDLRAINPRLVMLRVSGYGQTGPYRDLPGFGAIGEAMGGLRHLSGEPGRTPVRVGVSIGDSLSALHGVIGILLALRSRDATGQGQWIDVALYESVFNMMESLLPEYAVFGEVRQAAGSSLPGIAPSNAYRCQDNKYVLIAGNGDSIFKRLMGVIGRPDLADAPELANNAGRVKHVEMLDAAISEWTGRHDQESVLAALNQGQIPAGKIYDVADIAADPHYRARGMIIDEQLADGTPIQVPGVVPKLSATPGEIASAAPTLGQHTDEVLESLGVDAQQRAQWRARGLI
ncbi:CaiB/BaiF CoA transferase family protein [Bordetella hinzii]|uniref:CoA transferase n=2 Tax=Bordetella hinzii TaxID=103855 RepID=A0AAN1RUU6_9BORD|nr:CoA transferase [Bordetella hinzii]AKQ53616.1 Succinyl-CoA:(R)-benzylsuccinate CoA-transferase subunit BbsF [Bordetella hinzii]AKQ58176.1 Succinyl-CoA:(R)-benzylsuccinate CoA-transferase subunit BbsF [Bordetella hinzii]AZW16479.1 CoA transferase [Bordetella hinzii]KCB21356.1 CoA-transferase family III protein [Bordetella hinzii L60]KCB23175.1 CoA-transferase family III protein [Bordetella hinzii OH87 BAL007II]